jgi:hypothetical protein
MIIWFSILAERRLVLRIILFHLNFKFKDHGPINSWDRVPFLTTVATGKPSYSPAPNIIHNNFIMANYDAMGCIDNGNWNFLSKNNELKYFYSIKDDGSSWYIVYNNFCPYGGK